MLNYELTYTERIGVLSTGLTNKPHWKYRIKISNRGRTRYFDFNGSVHDYERGIGLKEKDVMYCLIADMNDYESFKNDPKGFCDTFGYENERIGMRAYNGCKTNSIKLRYLFNVDELNELQEEFENY